MDKTIRYIAVNPNGSICGPIGETESFVKKALVIAYKRTISPWNIDELRKSDSEIWHNIKRSGYKIKKAEIKLIDTDQQKEGE